MWNSSMQLHFWQRPCKNKNSQHFLVLFIGKKFYLINKRLDNLDTMFHSGFYLNDLSLHDGSRDLVLVGTQQSAELKLALVQEKQKSKQLEENVKQLDVEAKRADDLLYRLIPRKIADRLRSGEQVINLCEVIKH